MNKLFGVFLCIVLGTLGIVERSEAACPPKPSATETPGTTRTLDGWNNVSFGMTLAEVKECMPEFTQKSFAILYKDCARQAGAPVEDYMQEGVPEALCDYLEIENFDMGRNKFKVSIYFSRIDKTVHEIYLSLQHPDRLAYDYYKNVLQQKYGTGTEQNQENTEGVCAALKRYWEEAGKFTFPNIIDNKSKKVYEINLETGSVFLEQTAPYDCPFYHSEAFVRTFVAPPKARTEIINVALNFTWLIISYQPKLKPNATDLNRF